MLSHTDSEADSLSNLEARILKTVSVISELRSECERLRARAEQAEAAHDRAQQELEELRGERKQVRARIEKLLGQMDLVSNAG